jgi:hypothetical protein
MAVSEERSFEGSYEVSFRTSFASRTKFRERWGLVRQPTFF